MACSHIAKPTSVGELGIGHCTSRCGSWLGLGCGAAIAIGADWARSMPSAPNGVSGPAAGASDAAT